MHVSSSIMISGALVASSLIVAAALMFGRAPAPALPTPAPVQAVPVQAAPVQAVTVGPPTVVTPAMQERAVENARLALEARRGEMLARCWAPAVAQRPEPARIELRFVLGFDPTGRLAAVGVVADREVHRSDVTACLGALELAFKIPAPGLAMQVEVPFTLP